jgi:hypothetical protein
MLHGLFRTMRQDIKLQIKNVRSEHDFHMEIFFEIKLYIFLNFFYF